MIKFLRTNALYIAWASALAAMFGSLYFSEIKGYAPCILCWYQRIAMYPLVVVLGVGVLREDKNVRQYALPLAIIGAGIAFYHSLLQWEIIPETLAPCTVGVSCITKNIDWFGFVTIPFLSLLSFLVIIIAVLLFKKDSNTNI